jgi:hypothetical protein
LELKGTKRMSIGFRSKCLLLSLLSASTIAVLPGCGGTQSSGQALDGALATAAIAREQVYPLAGRVTIDGAPPQLDKRDSLVVMLNEPDMLDAPSLKKKYVQADQEGAFSFSSYTQNDGFKEGKYVLTFAILKDRSKIGMIGPDKLNNLYNDPDANSKVAALVIEHHAPGKSDYTFDLEVSGKAPAAPGPHALTRLVDERIPGAGRAR